ncbi:MAG: sodium:proton antiporter [Euryarchaeota archaeon]|nr:sodium:proton antiporter [Euryarchaeota archaeon]
MKGMSLIVRTISRLIVAPILLFGIYIVLHGHLTPGGGFPGGVIIAAGIALLILSYGLKATTKKINYDTTKVLDSFGAFLFVAIASGAIALGYFFAPYLGLIAMGTPAQWFSAGGIPYYNIAIGIKVAGALAAMFIGLVIVIMMGEEE